MELAVARRPGAAAHLRGAAALIAAARLPLRPAAAVALATLSDELHRVLEEHDHLGLSW